MKRKILTFTLITAGIVLGLHGCGDVKTTKTTVEPSSRTKTELEFKENNLLVNFYDNNGNMWLLERGSIFNIFPSKINKYNWDSNGNWNSYTEMSSVILIDGKSINSRGGIVILADSRLEKFDIDIDTPKNLKTETDINRTIGTPVKFSASDYLAFSLWWRTKNFGEKMDSSKIIIVQSQEGKNICMYHGNDISWNISKNLPKTTMITIDSMSLFIHNANFIIIDKDSLLNEV